jgi:choline dehydrogenase-like flavoprotein
MFDYLVVGAGLAGSTLAERLASQLGATVLVIDNGRTSPATPTIRSTRTACATIVTARTSSIRTREPLSITSAASRAGAGTSTACSPA